jgi:hypothetical protein
MVKAYRSVVGKGPEPGVIVVLEGANPAPHDVVEGSVTPQPAFTLAEVSQLVESVRLNVCVALGHGEG